MELKELGLDESCICVYNDKNIHRVGQYDLKNNLIQEFESAREASRQLNIDCGSISKCCRNKQKQSSGFTFKYITNENI